MFHQLLTPVGQSLALSSLVAALPVLVLVLLLGVFRRPAWQAALAGLIVGFVVAVWPWQMPAGLAVRSMLNGATFAVWPVVSLSGSDASGNALFGNLQVVAARQLNLNPILLAATNSSGGVMGKMISPQNIVTDTAVTQLKGQEGVVFSRTFVHSVVLTLMLAMLVLAQEYLIPWIIP